MPIRRFREADTPRFVALLGTVFAEYGMRFDPTGYDRDVAEAGSRFAGESAALFVAEDEGGSRPLGFAGVDLPRSDTAELHRLYIDPAARGRGLGAALCAAAEAWARERRAQDMELWSDVRFTHAHALYARRGYRLCGQRVLTDPDRSVELGFRRALDAPPSPTVPDAAAAARIPLPAVLADPGAAHRARMIAAAILDARALVRAGRLEGGGHALPRPEELFAPEPATREVDALILPGGITIGFARGESIRLHPLFQRPSDLAP